MQKLIFTIILFFSVQYCFADELEDFMLKQIQARELVSELYIEEYQVFSVTGDEYVIISKTELQDLLSIANAQNMKPELKSFKILSRSDTQDFVSAAFEYEWEMTVGNTNLDGKVEGIAVYLKTDEGYISIFDAQTQ